MEYMIKNDWYLQRGKIIKNVHLENKNKNSMHVNYDAYLGLSVGK